MMRSASRGVVLGFVSFLAVACGPTEEEKALKKERVELMKLQHEALTSGEAECGAAEKRLDAFEAEHKDRLEKFNKAWTALDEDKRDQLLGVEPSSPKEVTDELITFMISCGSVKLKVE